MKKEKFINVALSLFFILLMAMTCQSEDETARVSATAVDDPQYTPLSIQGEITDVKSAQSYKGRLHDSFVKYLLMARCADLMNPEEDPVTHQTCLTLKDSTHPTDKCDLWFCTMQIALCAGNLAMEIAQTAGMIEYEIHLDLLPTEEGSYVPNGEKGIPEIVNERLNGDEELPVYQIKIPPQAAEDKTIAIRLGLLGFFMGGVHGAEQLLYEEQAPTSGSTGYRCLDAIFAPPSGAPATDLINVQGDLVTKADIFSVTYGELIQNYSEAARLLVDNAISVGDSKFSQERDFSKASTLSWVGVNDPFAPPSLPMENSRVGALVTVAGGLTQGANINDGVFNLIDPSSLNSPHTVIRECTQAVDRDSIEIAISLLRASGAASILRESASDDDVISDVMVVLAQRFSMDSMMPVGTGHSMSTQEFLENAKITTADVHEAREYLEQEIRAHHRPIVPDQPVVYQNGDGTTSEVETVAGLANINGPLPGAFVTGKLASLPTVNPGGEYACSFTESGNFEACPYAETSGAATLDYLRWAASMTMARGLIPAEYGSIFKEAEFFARSEAGSKFVEMEATTSATGGIGNVTIVIHGLEEGEDVNLYFGDEGFYCANYGNIAGAPCDRDEYKIDAAIEGPSPDDEYFPGKYKVTLFVEAEDLDPTRLLDLRLNGGNPEFGSAVDIGAINVFSSSGGEAAASNGKGPQLMTRLSIDPEMTVDGVQRAKVVSGGLFEQTAAKIFGRSSQNCANPKITCAGLPYDLVPPLENELTEDADPYENSWRHYLDLARMKADRADQLGEELIAAGLAMDERAEGAMDQLEALCGEVNLDDSQALDWLTGDAVIEDPGLLSCLGGSFCPEGGNDVPCKRISVVLGDNPVCTVRDENDIAGVRREDIDYYEIVDPDTNELLSTSGKCVAEDSPFRVLKNNIPVCGFESPYKKEGVLTCLETLNQYVLKGDVVACTADADGCDYIVEEIAGESILRIFKTETKEGGTNGCEELEKKDPPDDDVFPEAATLERFANSDILDLNTISSNLRLIEFDEDFFYWYKFSMIGADEPIFATVPNADIHYVVNEENIEKLIRPGITDIDLSNMYERPEVGKRIAKIIMQLSQVIMQNPSVIFGREEDCELGVIHLSEDMDNVLTCPESSSGKVGKCASGPDFICDDVTCCSDGTRVDYDTCEAYGCGEITYPEVAQYNLDLFRNMLLNIHNTKFSDNFNIFYNPWILSPYSGLIFDQDTDKVQSILEDDIGCSGLHDNTFCFSTSDTQAQKEEMLNVLYFICGLNDLVQSYELDCLEKELPPVETVNDLNKVSKYLRCGADEINRKAAKIVIPNMPVLVAESFREGRFDTSYPATGGVYLTQLNRIQTNLNVFNRLTKEISEIMFQMANTVDLAQHEMSLAEIRGEIQELEVQKAIIQEAAKAAGGFLSAIGSFFSGDFGGGAGSASDAALAAASLTIDIKIQELTGAATEEEKNIILLEHMSTLHSHLTNLQNVYVGVQDAYLEIISAVNELDTIQNQAQNSYAKALMLGTDETGRVYPVNAVMRKRYSTLQHRYQQALKEAKQMAFVARKAIEFRLGVDLRNIHWATLVESPATWADSVCTLEGIDYEKISREELTSAEDLASEEIKINDYSEEYIGDYVTKLENYVESYSFDHPFSDGDDLAVISLKDDIMRAKTTCPVEESPNRIFYSEDFGLNVPVYDESGEYVSFNGWNFGGCQSPDQPCDPETEKCYDYCVEVLQDKVDCLDESNNIICGDATLQDYLGQFLSRADLIRDIPHDCDLDDPLECPRIEGYPNSGYVAQTILDLSVGWYIFSWYDMFPDISGIADITYANDYKVVLEGEGLELYTDTYEPLPDCTDGDSLCEIRFNEAIAPYEWQQRVFILHVPAAVAVEIRIHPSSTDDTYGMVWLAAMQLESFDPDDPDLPVPPEPIPAGEYYLTEDQRIVLRDGCRDVLGSEMRKKFHHVESAGTHEYYEYSFPININDIENGLYLTSNAIALNNYNYRHNMVALNLVGSNIIDCEDPEAATSCYSNGYLPYTLIHGGLVAVRNHEGQLMNYNIPDGRIEYGKGLAAEVVVTNPLNGSMETLLAPYQNSELRGRPIQGSYTIRIYDVPELDWSRVEDIQLIWNYHYWTKFGGQP